jgi:hypothetical protein
LFHCIVIIIKDFTPVSNDVLCFLLLSDTSNVELDASLITHINVCIFFFLLARMQFPTNSFKSSDSTPSGVWRIIIFWFCFGKHPFIVKLKLN